MYIHAYLDSFLEDRHKKTAIMYIQTTVTPRHYHV